MSGQPMVRALFRSVAMAGRPALSCKVYYPALYSATPLENNTGLIPAVRADRPYPVCVFMPGINVSPESYGWLATALAQSGIVTVLYGWILEEMSGLTSLTPGLDIDALKPGAYGTRPSATALQAVLADLVTQSASGPLAGLLDTNRILLGGHSAGGSVALMNARPDWFPGLRGVFAYGAHSKASTMLGYPADTLLPLPDALPLLVLGGSEDGVIASSAFRYGSDGHSAPDPTGPLERTFHEGIRSTRGDCHLAILRGANHFSATFPADGATGRHYLDWPIQRSGIEIRNDLIQLVTLFARASLDAEPEAHANLKVILQDTGRVALSATR
jgi:hypothetical protein